MSKEKKKIETHELVYFCSKESHLVHDMVNALKDTIIKCGACDKKINVDYTGMSFGKDTIHKLKSLITLGRET